MINPSNLRLLSHEEFLAHIDEIRGRSPIIDALIDRLQTFSDVNTSIHKTTCPTCLSKIEITAEVDSSGLTLDLK